MFHPSGWFGGPPEIRCQRLCRLKNVRCLLCVCHVELVIVKAVRGLFWRGVVACLSEFEWKVQNVLGMDLCLSAAVLV